MPYLPEIFNSKWLVYCVRLLLLFFAFCEFNLQICVIGPLVYGKSSIYLIYMAFLVFIFFNILGNTVCLVLVDTSIDKDACEEPELNVRLCLLCDRGVPPRCIHCDSCKECIPRRKTHITLLGKCIGYFNHRYFLVIVFYSMIYSANAVAIDLVYYNKILDKCDLLVVPISPGFYLQSHEEGVVLVGGGDGSGSDGGDVSGSSNGSRISVGVGNGGSGGDCFLLFVFFVSACTNFFILISTIFILTTETEFILTGKLKHENDAKKYNYDRGIKKNLICVLGYRWYMALLCPMARSKIPDMHAVLYRVGQQPAKFTL